MADPQPTPPDHKTKTQRPWLGRIWRVARLLLLAYLLSLAAVMWMEESLMFFPSVYPQGDWQPNNLVHEDAEFQAADGARLHGWFVPCNAPRAVVAIAHGNAGNLTDRADLVRGLHRLGAAVFIFDYRGYGRSQGKPNEAGVLADARAARRRLAELAKVQEQDIVWLGESLGGGVAVDLAARDGARGLILLNTFSSLPDVAAHHYPLFPVQWLMRNRLDSAAKIGNYHGPLLQFHGDADSICPLALAEKLYSAANEPKRLVVIHGGDHNDPVTEQFWDEVARFLTELDRHTNPRR